MITSGRLRRRRVPRGRRWEVVVLSPVILTLLITGLAFSTPREIAFSRLLPAAPALAAALWPVLPTILLGAFCLLAMIVLSFFHTDLGTPYTGAAIVAVTLAAAYASHLRRQREEMLFHVRLVADAAQKVLLRPLPRRIADIEIECLYLAAQEQARIGGDFYEAADTPYGVRLLIGDVRGKGLPAVGAASAVLSTFREIAYEEPDLRGIARRLETSITRYIAAFPGPDVPERFATVLIAEITRGGGRLRILNCGHPPPLLVHDGHTLVLDPSTPSPPLNLATLIGDTYYIDTVPFAPGDQLLLYTDGVTETRDPKGAFFPLPDWLAHQGPLTPQALLGDLHRDLLRYSAGKLDDDIAALALRKPTSPP
ncbi:serine/threonine-protein phosphatase [Streptomyces sp. WAC05374]|uniref:PP2C family protein-serine/threonine phosphatase n=1 Tax=Streptomyces sp. WAC05374 TaxID=2487420 RepID=UPI000F862647|nr:PP2C family protein-serine/threonine phosphatase [Streptomyces sp. WAC05374]RST09179.1 serine/threonine-protein phosphatase [Streptomyces sp. WAC05374]TDF44755.1 serine/threonine-protein phosphatase [Streptomyces sp. WAC05374]TDF55995.1 serine/threonine-protein phosphatase [Streptomyces sp. WAC05374]TDF59832.1 serine/threonine-protein phosphatase [Streptomyces sp. WAC05374]